MSELFEIWKDTRGSFHAPLFSAPLFRSAFGYLGARVPPGGVVLEIGCGHGHATHAFSAAGYTALGLDVHAPTVLEALRRYPGDRWVAATAERLPLPDGSVDAILCFSVLQYVDRELALSECRRVLRPGGHFVFVENLAGNPVARAYRAFRRLRGIRSPDHVEPKRHLRWGELPLYREYFSEVRYEAHFLLTPLVMLSRAALNGTGGRPATPAIRTFFTALHRAEGAAARLVPILRQMSWNVLVYGVR